MGLVKSCSRDHPGVAARRDDRLRLLDVSSAIVWSLSASFELSGFAARLSNQTRYSPADRPKRRSLPPSMSAASDASELMPEVFRILAQVARRGAWRSAEFIGALPMRGGLHRGLTRPDAGRHPPEPPGCRQLPRSDEQLARQGNDMVLRVVPRS